MKWVEILYRNPTFKMKNNGWLSKTCNMSRGIRQGCPISALLYLFVAEILAMKIKIDPNIKGININSNEIKSVQHADDLTITVRDDISFINTMKIVHEFCDHAGSKINVNKTEFLLLGGLKNTLTEINGIKVADNTVKCLGIYI